VNYYFNKRLENKILYYGKHAYFASLFKTKTTDMRKFTTCMVIMLLANILAPGAFAQNVTISGNVRNNATAENASAVSVTIKGSDAGTFTDANGHFSISAKNVPVTLVFSSVGYATQEVTVTNASQKVSVDFVPSNTLGQEVVVSATRSSQRILESPVSIERVSASAIRTAPAASYYDVVANLKGVDVVTSSLTFKTPTTRGFSGSGNLRFNQLVDGMDNQAPGLNFSVGSVIGLTQLDVDNMELLPGASSALYGPGGMNGTLLINSKNPFKYQGFSAEIKTGIMHTDGKQRPASPYYNWSMRWAQKVSDKFAFKVTGEFIQAKDWAATDERNYNRTGSLGYVKAGTRTTDPNYDGVNVYGDETSVDVRPFLLGIGAQAPFLQPFINTLVTNPLKVSRTGYSERDVINPNTVNFKAGASFNYKLSPGTEVILEGFFGTGNTVYTGSDRYSLKDLKIGQYKLEFQNKNWLLRGYTTQENSGQSFNAGATLALLNEAWKPSVTRVNGVPTPQGSDWYVQYSQAYLNNKLAGQSDIDASNNARAVADVGRPLPGTTAFKTLFDKVRKVPIPNGGLFVDRTDLYNVEGQYNLSQWTGSVVDVLIGGNYKQYVLNSNGTLFADKVDSAINIDEYGGYLQLSKKFLEDKLSISASGRYDKNQNFEGRFTPRATALLKVGTNKNVRLSYQTAYRFPSTQQQWIDLQLSGYKLIGGQPFFRTKYNFDGNPAYLLDDLRKGNVIPAGNIKYKPEQVSTFEVGYKGLHLDDKLLVDAFAYFGQYQDFITRTLIVQHQGAGTINQADTSAGSIYSVPVNISDKVKTYGFGLSVDYKLPKGFVISLNASSDQISDLPAGFVSFFNSPKYRANATISNNSFGKQKNLGFNITYRWQDKYFYQGDFASGNVPAFQTLDAQISAKIPATQTTLKLGANNLLNQYYINAVGNAQIGGLYYVSFGFNL
jgi:outer membrane receptor protein involved in Fe transport